MEIAERRNGAFRFLALTGAAAFAAVFAAEAYGFKLKTDPDAAGKGSARFLADQEACGNVFADVAEKTIPSVVSIYSSRDPFSKNGDEEEGFAKPGHHKQEGGRVNGLGSGVIVGPEGLILTNNHVIENARSLRVRLSDDREFDAELIAADKTMDLAVIRLKGKYGKLPALPLGDSDKLRVGEWVAAVGNPYGLSETVTTGIISAKGRKDPENPYGDFIQTDAAINPGNSGGALVNLKGELIGVNTAIVSQSGGSTGIGFAIPSNLARKVMAELVKAGATDPKASPASGTTASSPASPAAGASIARGWLGISIQTVDASLADAMNLKAHKGALVSSVLKGGPGDAAGLRRGDVILRVDDAVIADAPALLSAVAETRPGKEVDLTLMRGIKTVEVGVKVGRKSEERGDDRDTGPGDDGPGYSGPGAAAGEKLGLQVAEPDQGLRRRYHTGAGDGVVVLSVEDGSRAEAAGLKQGDFIVEAGNHAIASAEELQTAVAKARKKGKLVLRVRRGEEVFFAAVRFT